MNKDDNAIYHQVDIFEQVQQGNTINRERNRFQQIWFAVKHFSPIAQRKESNETPLRKKNSNCSSSNNNNNIIINDYNKDKSVRKSFNETTGKGNRLWSPFTKRRQRKKDHFRLYSSHPDISIQDLTEIMDDLSGGSNDNIDQRSFNIINTASTTAINTNAATTFLTRSSLSKLKRFKQDFRRCIRKMESGECKQLGIPNCELNRVELVNVKNKEDIFNDDNIGSNMMINFNQINASNEDESFQANISDDNNALVVELEKVDDCDTILKWERINQMLKYPFFQLDVHLEGAQNLLAKDSCGTSDPYAKFKIANQIVTKSRTIYKTLEPKWDEYFVLPINDIFESIVIKVYDYDYFFIDDYLGSARIDLTQLELGVSTKMELFLHNSDEEMKNFDENRGKLFLTVKLNPKTLKEKENFYGRGKWITTSMGSDGEFKKVKSQLWQSLINIVLIKGNGFNFEADYSIRFKLSNEKYKSKLISKTITTPVWTEQFELHLYANQSKMLEVGPCLFNQSDFIEKSIIDLSMLDTDRTHRIVKHFDNCGGSIELLITITGCQQNITSEQTTNLIRCLNLHQEMLKRYNYLHSFFNFSDVGHLLVVVYRAENLTAADINGKSDPFCLLELVNERLQTSTEYKTLCPEWNKIFSFNVKDVHEVLYITVFDEDKDRVEFLGKVTIPLLKIRNGEKRWYALKDKKLMNRVKGHILLQCWLSYNKFKASIQTFNPKEMKYIQPMVKFKRALFIQNVVRLKNLCMELVEWGQFINSCLQWEHPGRSMISFILFLTFVYFFEFYMLPLVLLILFAKNYITLKLRPYFDHNFNENLMEFIDETTFEGDDEEEKGEEKKSLKEKLQTIQETTTLTMVTIGKIASFMERIQNATNFTVPFLSWLAMICLLLATMILYYIPIRYLLLIWGINKFTKKFRSPDAIDNNELMNFLSRVPDMEERRMFKEFRPNNQLGEDAESLCSKMNAVGQSLLNRGALKKFRSDSVASDYSDKEKPRK